MNPFTESISSRIQDFILPEYFVILWVFLLLGFVFYKIFLKQISLKRKKNLDDRFLGTSKVLAITTVLSLVNWFLIRNTDVITQPMLIGFKFYTVALVLVLFMASLSFIKSAQIGAYLYLFFKNISVGIPRLIANLFTIVLCICTVIYLLSAVFSINLTTMVTTSAVFSIVLGLALQDTLGNLFSGVALQIGNPFSIGDWIEVQNGTTKWTGQVQEITWRSTFLISFSGEWTMIPNKIMSQSQIVIYSYNIKQVRQSLTYRFDFGSDFDKVKKIIVETIKKNAHVVEDPAPKVLLIESTESWVTAKVFYSIDDFEKKYSIADVLLMTTLQSLKDQGVHLAGNRLSVQTNGPQEA